MLAKGRETLENNYVLQYIKKQLRDNYVLSPTDTQGFIELPQNVSNPVAQWY